MNISLEGIPNYSTRDKIELYELAHKQEQFTVDVFNKLFPQRKWVTTEIFTNTKNNEVNRVFGDFVGINTKTHLPEYFFDLKVQLKGSNQPYYSGTIMLNSYFVFGYNRPNTYYIMANEYGANVCIIRANAISQLFKRGTKCIHETKFNRELYDTHTYDWANKYYINSDHNNGVAKNDYIPTRFITEFNLVNKS